MASSAVASSGPRRRQRHQTTTASSSDATRVVFVTVGTTRFDALVKAVLSEPVVKALAAQGFTRMVVQHGHSDWPGDSTAHGLHIEGYKLKPSLDEDMHEADAVISHGGAGCIFDALRAGCPTLVVINESLMGNHQLELAKELASKQHVARCVPSTLAATLEDGELWTKLKPLPRPNFRGLEHIIDEELHFGSPAAATAATG